MVTKREENVVMLVELVISRLRLGVPVAGIQSVLVGSGIDQDVVKAVIIVSEFVIEQLRLGVPPAQIQHALIERTISRDLVESVMGKLCPEAVSPPPTLELPRTAGHLPPTPPNPRKAKKKGGRR